jgi:F-type H+-transporting ATPase subunit b
MFDWWTLFFQTLNFFVVLFILYRLFFKPLRRVIEEREEAIGKRLETLEAGEARLEAERAAYDEKMKALEKIREKALEAAQKEALTEKDALMKEARAEMAKAFEKESAVIAHEREQFGREIRRKSLEFSLEYTTRLLTELSDPQLHEKSTFRFLEDLRGDEDIAPLRADLAGEACDVTLYSPFPQDVSLQQHVETALRELLGCSALTVTGVEDPSLICGIRLRIGNRVLDGSFRAALERFRNTTENGN